MKKVVFYILLTLGTLSTSFGQKQRVYLDANWRTTTAEKAVSYEEWEEQKGFLVGPFREYYISGKLKQEFNYDHEILAGTYSSYYESGQLAEQGNYVAGSKDGEWKQWHENGQLKQKEHYALITKTVYGRTIEQAMQDGLFEQWHENGAARLKGIYKGGSRAGTWEEWHDNKQLAAKGAYKEGYRIGVWEEWYANGKPSSKGSYQEVANKYNDSFTTKKEGAWEAWYENGQLAKKATYHKGDYVGTAMLWYSNGQKAEEYDFDKGILVNAWGLEGTQLVTNGTGSMKHYDASNFLISEGEYKNGLRTGNWTFHLKDGQSHSQDLTGKNQKITQVAKDLESIDGKIFSIVEEAAAPIGGMRNFYKYIKQHLKYPKAAKKLKQEGKVFLSFIVDQEGNIVQPYVIRSVSFSLDREALRILRESAQWKPAKQSGKPVRQRITFPINFRL